MTLTSTASTSAQALAMELGITDPAKKVKIFNRILALLTLERERVKRLDHAVEFAARWAWREDPPNANRKLTDSERLSAIKFHPTIKATWERSE